MAGWFFLFGEEEGDGGERSVRRGGAGAGFEELEGREECVAHENWRGRKGQGRRGLIF